MGRRLLAAYPHLPPRHRGRAPLLAQETAIAVRAANGIDASVSAPSYTLPTGHAANDLILLFWTARRYDVTSGTPSEYTACGSVASGTTGVTGADIGSVRSQAFYKVHDGSETSPITASWANSGWIYWRACASLALTTNGIGWQPVAFTTGSAESGSPVSVTGADVLDFRAGDVVVCMIGQRTDNTSHTDPSITIPGCILGPATEQLATNTSDANNDGSMWVYTATVQSGRASAPPNFTATTDPWMAVVFLRVRTL